jgi:hypothetical protein
LPIGGQNHFKAPYGIHRITQEEILGKEGKFLRKKGSMGKCGNPEGARPKNIAVLRKEVP